MPMGQGRALLRRINRAIAGSVLLGAAALLAPAPLSAGDRSYPGSLYAEFRTPNAPAAEERDNRALEATLEQGVDWARLADRLTLNTFAEMRYQVDAAGLDYNNRFVPALGAKLKLRMRNGIIQSGVKGVHEYRFESGRSDTIVMGFVNCWFGWDLGRR